MKITSETNLSGFQAWSGAVDTQNRIIECDKEAEFEQLIEELYPEGIDETKLNDILWFEEEWIYESLGITEEDELEDELEEEYTL